MNKHTITLLPENRVMEAEGEMLLIDLLGDAGIYTPAPCGGKGICGKCLVEVRGALSEPIPSELVFLTQPGTRLACQARIQGDCTVTVERPQDGKEFPSLQAVKGRDCALSIDIGTTTIKASLTDCASGIRYPFAPSLNPQRRYGHDVISRIFASSEGDQHRKLVELLRKEIGRIAGMAQKATGNHIKKCAVSGNTVMTYYFIGRDVRPLGVFPYTAEIINFDGTTPDMLGLDMPDTEYLRINPAASAFLGGDLVGSLALLEARGMRSGLFFIDIGTNGEMFLRRGDGSVLAASCAMGPALEGMSISSGMTASDGAITHVNLKGEAISIETFGGTAPVGISGTGIIDLIAILLRIGVIDSSGFLVKTAAEDAGKRIGGLSWDGGRQCLVVGGSVNFTQKDIRHVQLAKGASLSAARVLLAEAGCSADEIRTVAVAGSFGENLDIDNFRALSFIPDFPKAEYIFMGNTSLASAERSSIDPGFFPLMKQVRDGIRVVDLNSSQGFNDIYIESLSF